MALIPNIPAAPEGLDVTFLRFSRRSKTRALTIQSSLSGLSWLEPPLSPSPLPTPSLDLPPAPPTARIAPQPVVTVDVRSRLRLHGRQEAFAYPPTERLDAMDPNVTLTTGLVAANRVIGTAAEDLSPDELYDLATRLAGSLNNLDLWIRRGGFLPSSWEENR
jgi:hypothetical protein